MGRWLGESETIEREICTNPERFCSGETCYISSVRIRWDEKKRQWILKRRRIDFAVLDGLFSLPYLEDQRSDDPEQYRIIGFANGKPATFLSNIAETSWENLCGWSRRGIQPQQRNKPMHKKSDKRSPGKKVAIEEIAERAESGEDVSTYFTGRHHAKQNVTVDFPLPLLRQIDAECGRLGVTRQAWIKMVCDERIRQIAGSLRQRRVS